MRRTHSTLLPTAIGLGLLLGLPTLAQAKGPSNAETVAAAKGSPLFVQALKRKDLKKKKLHKVAVGDGIEMDLQRYVKETALDVNAELAPLFDKKLQPDLLTAAPTYHEVIYELQDRFVIERKLTIPLAPGACAAAAKPKAIADLCFTKNAANKTSKGITKDLAAIRTKLAAASDGDVVIGTTTVAKAEKMSDDALLELLLNTDARTVHYVSVVPRINTKHPAKVTVPDLDFSKKLEPAATADTGLVLQPPGTKTVKPILPGQEIASSKTFDTDYFLTGFTYGREIDDSWEYTFANATWLTDRYYIKVSYHVGLGFGVRAPFSVDVKSGGSGDNRSVELKVAPVDVDTNGNPAYSAVGLPASKTFGGKEFVMEFKASCGLYISIPGPNIDKKCPSIDKGFSRDIDPVIGSASSQIHDWWLDGSVTGLQLGIPAASVSLDVGLGADITNGKIGVRATGLSGATFSGIAAGPLSFSSTQPVAFTVNRPAGATGAALRLDQPKYGFDLRVRPKLRAQVEVDVAVWEKTWTLGPWALDFLAVSHNFQLGRHEGTVEKHDYPVFQSGISDVVVTADTLDPTPSKTPSPTKASAPAKAPVGAAASKLPQ